MTDAQIDRGDCDIPNEDIEYEEDVEEEIIIIIVDEEEYDTEGELPNDDVVVLEVDDINEDEEFVELTEEENINEEDAQDIVDECD